MILGLAFLVVVSGLAQILKTPPPRYVPPGTLPRPAGSRLQESDDYRPREMLRTCQFYVLWFMYACGAGAGLMITRSAGEPNPPSIRARKRAVVLLKLPAWKPGLSRTSVALTNSASAVPLITVGRAGVAGERILLVTA